ncbi:hypothetical protein H5410_050021 [Solanum commersonii]|uniref:Uncharacterized protein n=1 Tax=Solanum commersonii TaxID=4109 RepID=A0A9J5WUE8_SOLCO|nr:hypothetical protein H5410_050021 [Solanum commersonii]
MDYEEVNKNEECSWKQKSTSLCLKEDDRITKFSHKRYNNIKTIHVQEVPTIDDPTRINGKITTSIRSYTQKQRCGGVLAILEIVW